MRGRIKQVTGWIALAATLLLCVRASEARRQEPEPQREQREPSELVFSSVRREDSEGVVRGAEVRGRLDAQALQRAARPYSYFHETVLYDDEAWTVSDERGEVEYGYRVTRAPNPTPILPVTATGPPAVDDDVRARVRTAHPDTLVPLVLEARHFPEWDIPLRTAPFVLSAQDTLSMERARRGALRRRRFQARAIYRNILRSVRELGGEIVGAGGYSNWIVVRIPAGVASDLFTHPDVERISLLETGFREHGWRLGELRWNSRTNARQFIDNGYTGERSNPTRHGHGDLVVGVIENGLLEDEGCFLYDGSTCSGSTRLAGRFRCDDWDDDGNVCEPIASFFDNDSNASHGTVVSSTVLADYRQGQGDAYQLGDSGWTAGSGHSSTWKDRASGIAPEAKLIFFGQMAGDPGDNSVKSAAFADAFDDAIDLSVDVTNSSWGWDQAGGLKCTLAATQPFEKELENAFDDGILNVVSAGNANNPSDASVSCNMSSPADVVKAFVVNGLDGGDASCEAGYNNCTIDREYSATGGFDAKVNGNTYDDTITAVDIIAPTRISMVTWPTGSRGSVGGTFVGTSAAAPVVAGAAVLVKDWQLAAGNTWINYPGRLHTMMLAMADRRSAPWLGGSTSQMDAFASPLYGLGKLKLRLFKNGEGIGPWGYHMRTKSFTTGSSDHTYLPFSQPIPNGARMVKCVLMQDEDMSGKDDISKIDLEMRLKRPVNGQCSASGTTTSTRIDARRDTKKMGAIEDHQGVVAGRCLHINLDKEHVTSKGITTHTLCYYAGIDDDWTQ